MTLVWVGFLLFIAVILALDLGVFNKDAHVVKVREALFFAGASVVLALLFTGFVYWAYDSHWRGLGLGVDAIDKLQNNGRLAAVKFLTGYVIELSLSMDNVFVIALIFDHLKVPQQFQHRVLFWGILGALAMRGAMIGIGAALVSRYHWILYGFGLFLLYTGVKMLLAKEGDEAPGESGIVRYLRRHFPITDQYHGQSFLVNLNGKNFLTPLAIALVLVETTDLVFAVDSIPAIFAITADPFLVFTSNVFAILCLRNLYFGLAGLIEKFRYLKTSLAIILALVGAKMLVGEPLRAVVGPSLNFWVLGVVGGILMAGAVASAVADRRAHARP